MSVQQTIRKRLTSVRNVKHITEAIELVAGVKFRKLMQKMQHFRDYTYALTRLIEHLSLSREQQIHPLFQQREVQKTWVVIIGADKGLCGSYHTLLFKYAEKFLQKFNNKEVSLVLIGQRTIEHFKKLHWTIEKTIAHDIRSVQDIENHKEWASSFLPAFLDGLYDELWVVYTHFQHVLSKEPVAEKILPLTHKSTLKEKNFDYLTEPSPKLIYQELLPYFFYTKMQFLRLEAFASELASRIVAMKAANKNADDMIERLTLIKNKERQFAITKEILEIVAGAEGIK